MDFNFTVQSRSWELGRPIQPNITGNSSDKTEKDGVYTWAKANLYNSTTGEIYDAKGGVHGEYTYNYGFAMIAELCQGSNVMVPKDIHLCIQ